MIGHQHGAVLEQVNDLVIASALSGTDVEVDSLGRQVRFGYLDEKQSTVVRETKMVTR